MNPHYSAVAERAAHRCEYCHAPKAIFNFPFEVEHITPLLQGGSDDPTNRALACRMCNLWKSDRLLGVDPQTQASVRLFHPRRHTWAEHFAVAMATGAIAALTSVGRATVQRLQMNTSLQLAARQTWMRLGLFP